MLEWATGIIDKGGYLGVLFGMFMENIFPPIPSELVMIFSGASAAKGDMNIFLLVITAAVGSVIGLLPWYFAGKWYGKDRLEQFADRHGRLLTFSGKEIERADRWFDRHGKKAVLIGRFLPAVRTFIAIPAAIMGMKLSTFAVFAFLGSVIWDGAFAAIGYSIGENVESLERYVDIGTYVTVGAVLSWYVYRVATYGKKARENS